MSHPLSHKTLSDSESAKLMTSNPMHIEDSRQRLFPESSKSTATAVKHGLLNVWNMLKAPVLPSDLSVVEEELDQDLEEKDAVDSASTPVTTIHTPALSPYDTGKRPRMKLTRTRSAIAPVEKKRIGLFRSKTFTGSHDHLHLKKAEEGLIQVVDGGLSARSSLVLERKVEMVVVENDLWGIHQVNEALEHAAAFDAQRVELTDSPRGLDSDPSQQGFRLNSMQSSVRRALKSRLLRPFAGFAKFIWTHSLEFFNPRFDDPLQERNYRQEAWYTVRQGAVISSFFYVLAIALTAGLHPQPMSKYDLWALMVPNGILSFPLPFFVFFDLVRRAPLFYQTWLLFASWSFSYALIVEMYTCGYYTGGESECANSENFVALFYWSIAFPVMGLLGLGQKRIFHLVGICIWCLLVIVLILVPGAPKLMIRNLINSISLHVFLLMTSYLREKSSRRTYSLRQEVKKHLKSTEKARRAEKIANQNSKKFIAYVFHEVSTASFVNGSSCNRMLT